MVVTYGCLNNLIKKPYRQSSITKNTETIMYNGGMHYITPDIKYNIQKLNSILNSHDKQSEYLFAVSRLIGEVVFSGKSFPSTPIWDKEILDSWLKLNKLPSKFFFISNHLEKENVLIFKKFNNYNIEYIDEYTKKSNFIGGSLVRVYFFEKKGFLN
mgnify:FL=1